MFVYSFPNLDNYLSSSSSASCLSVDYLPGLSTPPLSSSTSSASDLSVESTFGMRLKGSGNASDKNAKNGGAANGGPKKKGKPAESNGVRALKKASTRGMSPLTSFFAKKSPTPGSGSDTKVNESSQ
jgi:hypothetical protein